jgi:transcription elongation factor GreA
MEYKIVGSTEVDCLNNKISNESPVGAALIGAAKGDIIEIETPNGEMIKYEVMSVSR